MVTCAMALAANVTNYEGESESNQNVFFNFAMLSALLIASAATSMDSLCHCEAVLSLNGQLLCHSSPNMATPTFHMHQTITVQ
jgi:hypothetical protein